MTKKVEHTFISVNVLTKRAFLLSWFTITYNLIEGIISVAFGISESSMSLLGFGVDSFIEVTSASIVLWRLRVEIVARSNLSIERERKATLGIGVLFLILGIGTFAASVLQLTQRSHPKTTLPGLIISLFSLSFMFFLWDGKRKLGQALSSSTILKDAACSLVCIKLSVILFLGSLAYLMAPTIWWVDSVAAILLSYLIGKEGIETINAARKGDIHGCSCE